MSIAYLETPTLTSSTSTVSNTFITPGCLKVRSFRTALRARGSRDLFSTTSKVNILQSDLFSCTRSVSGWIAYIGEPRTYSPHAIEEFPD